MLSEIKPIRLVEGIFALGPSIWMPKERVLIISDLHIGYEEALNKEGILVPRQQFKLTKALLERMLSSLPTKPEAIMINGDLKHEFGKISEQEWRETLKVLDILTSHAGKVVLVKGNHDTILEPIARKREISIVDFYFPDKKKELCITHGHKIWKDKEFLKAKTIIIGNEHPSISIREGAKSELYKCFLVGKWRRKNLIVMPSLLPIIEGTDVRKEKLLSPYLHRPLKNFEVFIVGDKVYRFGKLGDLR